MNRTYICHPRIIDGTGTPAIEDGLFIFTTDPNQPDQNTVDYVGVFDSALIAEADENDLILNLPPGTYTMTPGLFNVHAHLDLVLPYEDRGGDYDPLGQPYRSYLMYRRAAEALHAGITTIRNVGAPDDIDVYLRNAIRRHMLPGPNIVACGNHLIADGGHGCDEYGGIRCSGADEFRKAARRQCALGVDQIKLMYTGGMASANEGLNDMQMTDEEVAAVIWTAHAAHKKTCAHLSNDAAIRRSVELGIDSVEHGYTLSEETAKLMAEKGTYFVPTLCVSACTDYLIAHGAAEHQVRKGLEAARTHKQSVIYAHKHGVKICVGTDLLPADPVDGTIATIREMELLTECGLTPLEAIRAATETPAELCDLSDITGTLKAGLMGDFLLVEGKPDDNIRDIRNLKVVSKNCCLIRSELPEMQNRYDILRENRNISGGTFVDWGRKGRF